MTLTILGMVLFTLTFVPFWLRPVVARRAQVRLVDMADRLWSEVRDRQLTGNDRCRLLHDAILSVATETFLMVGDCALEQPETAESVPARQIVEFVEDNPWLVKHVSELVFVIWILGAFGQPWRPSRWLLGAIGCIGLKVGKSGDGRVINSTSAVAANEISRLRTFRTT